MMSGHEDEARSYLRQLHARHGWTGAVEEEDVKQLVTLLERLIADERRECLEIVEATVRLYGSYTAEYAAHRIRERGEVEQ